MKLSLKFHPKLYHSESISEAELEKIKKQLEKKPLCSNVFLITPAENTNDLLEFYHSRQLNQRYYQNHPPYIIGITRSYKEALIMIEQLAKECLEARGDCALREYLLC